MSLLQQNANGPDDAARGEEFTRDTSRLGMAAIIAAVVVTAMIALYIVTGQKPAAATGQVVQVTAHVVHRETKSFDAGGAAIPKEEFDQLLLFTRLKVHNQSKNPLFIHDLMANVTMPDGIHSSTAASPVDYQRLFQASPELISFKGAALPTDSTIAPGQTLEGDFVSAFRMSKAEWDSHKALDFSVAIRYQPTLKLTPAAPVLER